MAVYMLLGQGCTKKKAKGDYVIWLQVVDVFNSPRTLEHTSLPCRYLYVVRSPDSVLISEV